MDQLPKGLREFDDTDAARANIYTGVLDAVSKRFPVEDDEWRVDLVNPRYQGKQDFSLTEQKNTLLRSQRLVTPIVGTWQLTHKPTGKVVEEKEDVVMNVPYYTGRGTFIHNGNEYSVLNQARLRPGIYVRRKRTGEIETQFNVESGKGRGFRMQLEPSTGVFKVNIGQSAIPAYPFLRAAGVSDDIMKKNWGQELYAANASARNTGALKKLYERIAGYNADPEADETAMAAHIRDALPKFAVDKDVVERTLGLKDKAGIDADVLARATQKMLAVSKGDEDPDDRDAPQFKEYFGVEDLLRERVDKDAGRLTKNLLFKIRRSKSLKPMQRGILSRYMDSLLLGSGLALPLEETNPLHYLEQMNRVTGFGEGGIGSTSAVTDDARELNPGQLGFIGTIEGPENERIGVDARIAYGAYKGDDKRIYGRFQDVKTGKTVFLRPDQTAAMTLGFASALKSNAPYVTAIRRGQTVKVPRSEVDIVLPELARQFAQGVNLSSMPTAMQAGRQFYASKFWTQYLPLKEGEVPLVDSLTPDGKTTFMEYYGRKAGTLRSAEGGIVRKVTDDQITIEGSDGKLKTIDTVKDLPFNRLSVAGSTEVLVLRQDRGIEKLQIKDYVAEADDKILSYDPMTKTSSWCRIQGFTTHSYPGTLVRVDFASGRSITVTPNHSLLTLNDAFDAVPVYPSQCVLGVTRCPIVFGSVDSNSAWSRADGILDGLYLAEGSLGKRQKNCKIAVDPSDRIACVKQLVLGLGQVPNAHKGPDVIWTDHGRWSRWQEDFGKYAARKHIAGYVYGRGRDYLEGLMAGYMAGDGCLHTDVNGAVQLEAGSISEQLRNDLVSICTLLGVMTLPKAAKPNGKNSAPIYRFRICTSSINKLQTWFAYPDREAKLRKLMKTGTRASMFDSIPVTTTAARKHLYSCSDAPIPHYIYKSCSAKQSVAKSRVLDFSGNIGLWAVSDVKWDLVEKLTEVPAQDQVYDFSVEGSEAFATADGLLVHNTGISYTATVRPGDIVKPGGMVAHSNFTDAKTGSINFGRNLKVAMIPARGLSNDDSIVISESASKKLATSRLYGFDLEAKHGVELGRDKYMSLFPSKFTKEQFANLDENGIIKAGTVLTKGDPIIVGVGPKLLTAADAQLGKLHKALRNSFTDKAVVWEHDYPGQVTDAVAIRGGSSASVNVKAEPPVEIGDKLSSNFAVKGVVGRIIPDAKMPQEQATGEPYEILFNPMAILSRVSPNQIVWMALAKVAKKTGKQLRLPQERPPEGWAKYAQKLLKENGISDTADIFDPESGKTIPGIGDGYAYVHAFHHLSEKKLSVRGGSGGYSSDDQPAKGGYAGAKRFSGLDVGAALSHGATAVLKDVMAIRGTRNDNFWKALRSGQPLPEPTVPFVYTKFLNTLRAGGINVREHNGQTQILPMTDRDVDGMGAKEIKSSEMLDYDFNPRPGGLFDPGLTGGTDGNRWTYLKLEDPVPNPVMEEPVRRVLGLTGKQLHNIISGTEELNGKTGGIAIKEALEALDPAATIEQMKAKVKTSRGAARDHAVKVISYLDSAMKNDIKPSDWMVSKIPVIPPRFRPIARMGDMGLVADLNELYRDLIETEKSVNQMKGQVGVADLAEDKLNVYNAVKAVYGLGDPITPEGQSKRLKGAIWQITGDSPKHGLFQSRVVAKTVGNVARGVVTPDPDLDMDHIGIPEKAAWDLYKDFVIRRLTRKGYPVIKASEMVADHDPAAKDALEQEMSDRPVIADRAPTWHKFNLLAFYPQLRDGNTIAVSPLVTKGFNMDFDGDQQLNSVLTRYTDPATIAHINRTLGSAFLRSRAMKRGADSVVVKQSDQVYILDLADFPHGPLVKDGCGTRANSSFFVALPGTQVLALDESTGHTVWADVEFWSTHSGCSIDVVTLANGHQIFTDDDPRAVYGIGIESMDYVRMTPSAALAAKVMVPVSIRESNIAGALSSIPTTNVNTGISTRLVDDFPLTQGTGYTLGVICGDGWATTAHDKPKAVAVAGASWEVFAEFDKHFTAWFVDGNKPEASIVSATAAVADRHGDCDKITYTSVNAGAWVHDICGAGAENKHLPPFFLTGNVSFRKGLFAGLMDTDGTITCVKANVKKAAQLQASFGSKSLRMAREVVLLAASLGIRAHITPTKTPAGLPFWHVGFSAVDIKRWNADGMKSVQKLAALAEAPAPDANSNVYVRLDQVPYPRSISSKVSEALVRLGYAKRSRTAAQACLYTIASKAKATGTITRATALQLAALGAHVGSADAKAWEVIIENTATTWSQVEAVEASGVVETGYDLTVPDYETFMAVNGTVLSNTSSLHVPASDKAKEEAKRKMIPSVNLFSTTDLRSIQHAPRMEMTMGLWQLTRPPSNRPVHVYASVAEAKEAYRRGEIKANDPIDIKGA